MPWYGWVLGPLEALVAYWLTTPCRGRVWARVKTCLDDFHSYRPAEPSRTLQTLQSHYVGLSDWCGISPAPKAICWNCNKPHDGPSGRCPECAEKYGPQALLPTLEAEDRWFDDPKIIKACQVEIGKGSFTRVVPTFGPMATALRDQLRAHPEDWEKLTARFGNAWVPPHHPARRNKAL